MSALLSSAQRDRLTCLIALAEDVLFVVVVLVVMLHPHTNGERIFEFPGEVRLLNDRRLTSAVERHEARLRRDAVVIVLGYQNVFAILDRCE